MPALLPNEAILGPGDIYEDSFCHPCLCLGIDRAGTAWGISLADGSWPRRHDLFNSATRKLSLNEAFRCKIEGPDSIRESDPSGTFCAPPFYEMFRDGIGGSLGGTDHADRGLAPGGFYEDCAYHPCLTMAVDGDEDDIWGISLVDGSWPRSCSLRMCGVVSLTIEQAWRWKLRGPDETIEELPAKRRWWTEKSSAYYEQTRSDVGRELSEAQLSKWRQSIARKSP